MEKKKNCHEGLYQCCCDAQQSTADIVFIIFWIDSTLSNKLCLEMKMWERKNNVDVQVIYMGNQLLPE